MRRRIGQTSFHSTRPLGAYGLNEDRGAIKLDMGTELSVGAQPVGPLSQKHTTIIRATGNQACCPFLVSRQCSLRSHKVRHEFLCFLCLPKCPVGLGQGLVMQAEGTDNF
jgi:hypothetical protein